MLLAMPILACGIFEVFILTSLQARFDRFWTLVQYLTILRLPAKLGALYLSKCLLLCVLQCDFSLYFSMMRSELSCIPIKNEYNRLYKINYGYIYRRKG